MYRIFSVLFVFLTACNFSINFDDINVNVDLDASTQSDVLQDKQDSSELIDVLDINDTTDSVTDTSDISDTSIDTISDSNLSQDLTFSFNLKIPNTPGLIFSRMGSPIYLQSGDNDIYASSEAELLEDRGSEGIGHWTFAAYDNEVDPNFVGWEYFDVDVAHEYSIGPDGITRSTLLTDSSTSAVGHLRSFSDAFRPPDLIPSYASVWFKNVNSSAALAPLFDGGYPVSLSNDTIWKRSKSVWNKYGNINSYALIDLWIAGATVQNGALALNPSSTGSLEAWGAQAARTFGDVPLVVGSTGPATIMVSNERLTDLTGELNIEGGSYGDSINNWGWGCYWSMSLSNGDDLCMKQTPYGNNGAVELLRNGVTILSQSTGYLPLNAFINWHFFDLNGVSGWNLWINGWRSKVWGTSQRSTDNILGGASVTSFHIGSRLGTDMFFDRRHTFLKKTITAPDELGNAMIFGDSIIALGLGKYVLRQDEAEFGTTRILDYSIPGQTILQQYGHWLDAKVSNPSPRWVFMLIGINDVQLGSTNVEIIDRLKIFVDDILNSDPNTIVLVSPLTPARGVLDDTRYQNWLDANTGLTGSGSYPFLPSDPSRVVILPEWTQLNNGSGYLLSQYQNGDQIHVNYVAHTIMGGVLHDQLTENGLLP